MNLNSRSRQLDLISIVVPCHNEGENVEVLTRQLTEVLNAASIRFEIIFVDDSTDDTPLRIARLHQRDSSVKMRRLTRSFGQSHAIFAGLQVAHGNAIVVMDGDLEDPPASIIQLIDQWREGFDIVAARRRREGIGFIYRLMSRIYYKLMVMVSNVQIPQHVGEYRLMDRRVVETLNLLPEGAKFFRGLSAWPGYQTAIIDIERHPRHAGKTNYSFFRSFSVALDGLFSFSFSALRMIAITGFILSTCSALMMLVYLVLRIVNPSIFGAGWASLFIAISFFSSINMLFLGIVAEYVGRIFQQVQGRPSFIVDYDLGINKDGDHSQVSIR